MDFKVMPQIRLEVEHMKHSIISHLGMMNSELGEALSAEIQKAADNYPWQEEVERIVKTALSERIDNYFKYGVGAKSIQEAVYEGFKALEIEKPEIE